MGSRQLGGPKRPDAAEDAAAGAPLSADPGAEVLHLPHLGLAKQSLSRLDPFRRVRKSLGPARCSFTPFFFFGGGEGFPY